MLRFYHELRGFNGCRGIIDTCISHRSHILQHDRPEWRGYPARQTVMHLLVDIRIARINKSCERVGEYKENYMMTKKIKNRIEVDRSKFCLFELNCLIYKGKFWTTCTISSGPLFCKCLYIGENFGPLLSEQWGRVNHTLFSRLHYVMQKILNNSLIYRELFKIAKS